MDNIPGLDPVPDELRKFADDGKEYSSMAFKVIKECKNLEQLSLGQRAGMPQRLQDILKFKEDNNFGPIRMTIDLNWLRDTCHNIIDALLEEDKAIGVKFCKEVFDFDPTNDKVRLIMSLPKQPIKDES